MAWEDIIPQRGVRVNLGPGVTMSWRVKKASAALYVCIASHVARELGWEAKQRVSAQRNAEAGQMRFALSPDAVRSFSLHGTTGARALALTFRPAGLDHLTESIAAEAAPHRITDGFLVVDLPGWARPGAKVKLIDKPAPAVTASAPAPATVTVKWTPERNAVIARMYPAGATGEEMAQAVNALPGVEDATPVQCVAKAGNLKLKRLVSSLSKPRQPLSDDRRAELSATLPAAATAHRARKMEVGPPDVLAAIDADDLEEARRMIRSGKHGAKTLADHFGWEHERAIRIAAAIRDEEAAAA